MFTRILAAAGSIILTLFIAAFAFAYTAVEFPSTMRSMLFWARHVPEKIETVGFSDQYLVWVDLLLGGDKLVFMVYVAVVRVLLVLVTACIGLAFIRREEPSEVYITPQSDVLRDATGSRPEPL